MAATDTDLAAELRLADLLQRVEALEQADAERIEKKNKLTIIAWGGDLDRISAHDDPGHDRRGLRDGVVGLLHVLGASSRS